MNIYVSIDVGSLGSDVNGNIEFIGLLSLELLESQVTSGTNKFNFLEDQKKFVVSFFLSFMPLVPKKGPCKRHH